MKFLPVLTALIAAGAAMPVLAQKTPYETKLYQPSAPTPLDKDFGMRTYEMPQARTQAPQARPSERSDPFAPPTGLSDRGTDSPNDAKNSDVPDFFNGADTPMPKSGLARSGSSDSVYGSAPETPLFTTSNGYRGERTTGGMTTGTLGTRGDGWTTGGFGSPTPAGRGGETGDTTDSGSTTGD